MKLGRILDNFQFIEEDCFGNYKINWRKFITSLFIAFLAVTIILAASFSLLHVFPPTDVYYDTMEYDETQFVFNFDDTGKDANSHLKNIYLTSNELNIFNKKLYANDGNNYSYYINVPKNVTHFQLDVTFEAEFPYISQHIIIDVERV